METPETGQFLLPCPAQIRHRDLIVDGDSHLGQDFHIRQYRFLSLTAHRNDHFIQ